MDKLFDTVLELSWQAGLIALAVMAVRLVLRKKASRRALCILWALVALRLLLPVSLTVESPVSLQAEEAPVSRAYHAMQEARTSVPEEAAPAPAESSGAAAAVVPTEPAAEPVTLWTFARWLPSAAGTQRASPHDPTAGCDTAHAPAPGADPPPTRSPAHRCTAR